MGRGYPVEETLAGLLRILRVHGFGESLPADRNGSGFGASYATGPVTGAPATMNYYRMADHCRKALGESDYGVRKSPRWVSSIPHAFVRSCAACGWNGVTERLRELF
jgi:hypothetical protein